MLNFCSTPFKGKSVSFTTCVFGENVYNSQIWVFTRQGGCNQEMLSSCIVGYVCCFHFGYFCFPKSPNFMEV